MCKLQRNERIAALTSLFTSNPGKLFTLSALSEILGAAKSTLSEDIDIIDRTFSKIGKGRVQSIAGAAGGVRYTPGVSQLTKSEITEYLCMELMKKERVVSGGYLYMLDIIYNPEIVSRIADIFVSKFADSNPDYVITVETKGIPLAFMTAKFLNIPLVIVRHNIEATDGSSVNVNYISGSSKTVQTMVLPTRALKRNSRLLFIDDFMKGGGTAKGIYELAKEFDCEVAGTGVLIKTKQPEKKLVQEYYSLLTLNSVDEQTGLIDIAPSDQDL